MKAVTIMFTTWNLKHFICAWHWAKVQPGIEIYDRERRWEVGVRRLVWSPMIHSWDLPTVNGTGFKILCWCCLRWQSKPVHVFFFSPFAMACHGPAESLPGKRWTHWCKAQPWWQGEGCAGGSTRQGGGGGLKRRTRSPHWSVDITEIQGSCSTAEWQDVPRCAKMCQVSAWRLEGTRYMELRGLNGWIWLPLLYCLVMMLLLWNQEALLAPKNTTLW